MDKFVEELLSEIEIEVAFTIPIFGGIDIYESTVGCWIVMGVLILIAIILGRNLKVKDISKRQALAELLVVKAYGFIEGIMGEKYGKRFAPYLITVLAYIGTLNITGMFGLKPPTKDLNVTIALALMTILITEGAGIRFKGIKGWLKSFVSPVAIVLPINVLEIAIKPMSLCFRLFGNVLGAFIIMAMLELVIPIFVPVVFSLYFDIFDGFLQAYVFTFLSAMYIAEMLEED